MNLLSMAARNLRGHRVRSALTLLGLAVAVAAFVALTAISAGFESAYQGMYRQRDVDLIVQRAGGDEVLLKGINEQLLDKVRAVPNVARAFGGLVDVISFEQYDLFFVLIHGIHADHPFVQDLHYIAGRGLREDDRDKVILGHTLAANLEKSVGQSIELYGSPFEIVGVFESFSSVENSAAWIHLDDLQRMTDRTGQLSGILVTVQRPVSADRIQRAARDIEHSLQGVTVTPTDEFVSNVREIRWIRGLTQITSLIAVLVASLGIGNTMVMSVMERMRELGTLRAIGWRKSRIVRLVMSEAGLISFAGAACGILLAQALVALARLSPITAAMMTDGISWPLMGQAIIAGLLIGLLGAVGPAIWSARLSPCESLRRS